MMTDKIGFNGNVNADGKLHIVNRSQFDESVKRFSGKDVEIIVQKKRVVRSDPQNKFYWSSVVPEMQIGFRDLGYDWSKEQTHDFIKTNFNYREIVNQSSGEILRVPMSTARLTKTEFSEMIEKIAVFAVEYLNITISQSKPQLASR